MFQQIDEKGDPEACHQKQEQPALPESQGTGGSKYQGGNHGQRDHQPSDGARLETHPVVIHPTSLNTCNPQACCDIRHIFFCPVSVTLSCFPVSRFSSEQTLHSEVSPYAWEKLFVSAR